MSVGDQFFAAVDPNRKEKRIQFTLEGPWLGQEFYVSCPLVILFLFVRWFLFLFVRHFCYEPDCQWQQHRGSYVGG